jgi:glycerophosphoryl diester phosphodiesterase
MGHEPENTLRSIQRALDLGAPWIEIDVYCVDGRLVVIHDDRLERTTNGRGAVMECSLAYLRSLDAGHGERIPFLEEVFDLVGRKAGVNVELKGPGTAEPVGRFLTDRRAEGWAGEQLLVSSFDRQALGRLKRSYPELRVGVLRTTCSPEVMAYAQELGAYSVHPGQRCVDQKLVDDAHARGLAMYVFTVNEAEDIRRMRELGVDGVFTDYPERVLLECKI